MICRGMKKPHCWKPLFNPIHSAESFNLLRITQEHDGITLSSLLNLLLAIRELPGPLLMVLLPPGVLLLLQLLGPLKLGLLLEDVLDKHLFVLELVSLGGEVEAVVQVFINLLLSTVLLQQSPEDSLPSHPKQAGGHAHLLGPATLSETTMSSYKSEQGSLGLVCLSYPFSFFLYEAWHGSWSGF